MDYILGLNLSHDSSSSLHALDGKLVGAIEEERFTRRKNEASFPANSINHLLRGIKSDSINKITKVVIGSHRNPNDVSIQIWHQIFNPPIHPGWPSQPHIVAPGSHKEIDQLNSKFRDSATYVKYEVDKALSELGLTYLPELIWIAHHDAHVASGAIGAPWRSSVEKILAFSLDGSGDDESGAVQVYKQGSVSDLIRIPFTKSLGLVYSEVTSRYGFKRHRHEGKITGLAALGRISPAVKYLLDCIVIKDGSPEIQTSRSELTWILNRVLVKMKASKFKRPQSIERMIEVATSMSPNYPDLAFAIQEVVEVRIVELIKFWIAQTNIRDVSLAGGVFSNVKLNQKIAELDEVKKVFIFPNMGDGGLSTGGVWRHLQDEGMLSSEALFDDMYLGSNTTSELRVLPEGLSQVTYRNSNDFHQKIAQLLAQGFIGGSCFGRMEFGPRALGNRSILASPFDSQINQVLNERLNRTEFMPFAPIVLAEYASDIFDLTRHESLIPFQYMTMTCNVRSEWISRIPAVVHSDFTARPQIITRESNPLIYSILLNFYRLTKVPILINTSFNAHEEPIIENINQAINNLNLKRVDFVFNEDSIFSDDEIQ
jgi:carbamoyltransferase